MTIITNWKVTTEVQCLQNSETIPKTILPSILQGNNKDNMGDLRMYEHQRAEIGHSHSL